MVNELSVAGQRAQEILQELLRSGKVTVDDLAQRLQVSAATIRRDLGELERRGLLRRNHGGASSIEPALYEPFRNVSSFQEQEQQLTTEKRRIGLAAAEMISDGETIALGAGTTTTQVARSLRHRKGITVLTNAVNIAMELSHQDNIKILLTGGVLSGAWFALVGPAAIQSVREFFVNKAFIGVDGMHAEDGLTTNYPEQATIHRAMLQQARQKIVIADHRKIGVAATALIWPANGIDLFITDKSAADETIEPFIAKGIKVRRA
jgi:DeoR family transcriptional regulator of aga operon